MSAGITLDTGALVSLERRHQRIVALMAAAHRRGVLVQAPAPVVAEWWRKRTDVRDAILEALTIEPMDDALARRVGETLAAVPGASLVDATVMVCAARRGDTVLTADIADFARLGSRFPAVRILRV